jgi:hypothetical protein
MFLATHASIRTRHRSNQPRQLTFSAITTLPYYLSIPSFGGMLEPRYIIRATAFDQ